MARAIYYPPALRSRWYSDIYPGVDIEPNVLVWHTTETGHVPRYGGGASAPHLTYDPSDRQWHQHFRLDRSARALRNEAGGVETNTLNACQVEIVAYADERLARERGHLPVSRLSDANLRDLAGFARFMWDEWGLKLDIDPGWVRDDYRTPDRMTFSEWRNFYGHTAHNRVPENTHWDVGRLDIWTIIDYAEGDDDVRPSEWNDADQQAVREALHGANKYAGKRIVSRTPYNVDYHLRLMHAHMEAARQTLDVLATAQAGGDVQPVVEEIRAHHGEVLSRLEAAEARDAAIAELLDRHNAGSISPEAVVDGVRDLLHQATAPADDAT